jgi:hypothetical protein
MPNLKKIATKRVDTLVLVKALSMLLLVANHAPLGTGLHGGLNGLLLVSGISMATFAFNSNTHQTLQAFLRFTLRLAIPSVILAFIICALKGDIRWMELGLISNWVTKQRVTLFPIWYVQCMVQLMLALGLVFWAFNLTPKLAHNPVKTASLALATTVGLALTSYALWDTVYLHDKLPHLIAWNFVFGWFYWAMLVKGERTFQARLIVTGTLLLCEVLIFILADAAFGEARILWLTLLALPLIWLDDVKLPTPLAHLMQLLGQATLYIFLLHHVFFSILIKTSQRFGYMGAEQNEWLMFAAGLTGPVLVFAAVSGLMRTLKKMQREGIFQRISRPAL